MGKCFICNNPLGLFNKKSFCSSCATKILKSDFTNSGYLDNLLSYEKNKNDAVSFINKCDKIRSLIKKDKKIDFYNMNVDDKKASYINFYVSEFFNKVVLNFVERTKKLDSKLLDEEFFKLEKILDICLQETIYFDLEINSTLNQIRKIKNVDNINEEKHKYFFNVDKKNMKIGTFKSFLVAEEYAREKVIDDFKLINVLIKSINKDFNLSLKEIDYSKLNFGNYDYDNVYFEFEPFTSTGKDKKTPFTLFFDINKNGYKRESNGIIYYSIDGIIQKCTVSTINENDEKFSIRFMIRQNKLLIKEIYTHNKDGIKKTIFK